MGMLFHMLPITLPSQLGFVRRKAVPSGPNNDLPSRAATFPAYAAVPISISFYKSDPIKKLIRWLIGLIIG